MQLFRGNKTDIHFKRVNYDFVKLHEIMESSGTEGENKVIVNSLWKIMNGGFEHVY